MKNNQDGARIALEIGRKFVDILNTDLPPDIGPVEALAIASTAVAALTRNIFLTFFEDDSCYETWIRTNFLSFNILNIGRDKPESTH